MKKKVTSDLVKVAILNLEEIEKTYLAELSSLSEKNNNIKENLSLEILELKDEVNKLRKERTILSKEKEECNILLKTKEKQLEKYKNLLNLTPGTEATKVELLEYFTETIIPYINEKIESKHTSKIKEYLEKGILNKEEYNEKKSLEPNSQKYYVYSHTIEGEQFPFYIGFSRNIDGNYNRSKDFSTRSYPWFEYIFSKGGFNNVKINTKILVEIETEKEALELETYFIKYYSESVVNTLKK